MAALSRTVIADIPLRTGGGPPSGPGASRTPRPHRRRQERCHGAAKPFAFGAKPLSQPGARRYGEAARLSATSRDGMDMVRAQAVPTADMDPGEPVRRTRKEQRLTLPQLWKLTGYSAAQVSRYEWGVCPLTDVTVLRRFADAPSIPPQALGLAPQPDVRHGHVIGPTIGYPCLPGP